MKAATVWIPASVVQALEREADEHYPRETGGALLGFADAADEGLLQIVTQTGPGPEAGHFRHRFEPDCEWQERRIATIYLESGRLTTYLGDWHSHPGGTKRPSRLDRKTAVAIARTPAARAPYPLMLILAGEPGDWTVGSYRYRRRRLRAARTRLA